MLRKTIMALMAAAVLGGGMLLPNDASARGGGHGFGGHGFGGGFHGGFHGFHGFHGGGFHHGFYGGFGGPFFYGYGPDYFDDEWDAPYYDETCGWVRVKYRYHKRLRTRLVYRCS